MVNRPPSRLADPARLAALRESALLDSAPDEAFDRLTRLVTKVLNVPVALVSLVADDHQYFKSCVGPPEMWASGRRTALTHSFCQHVVASGEPLVVEDARLNPLVRDNLAVTDLNVIAYAGVPLFTSGGFALGAFCAIDGKPRAWRDEEVAVLRDLAASVTAEMELLAAGRKARTDEQERARLLAQLQRERRRVQHILRRFRAACPAATHPPPATPPRRGDSH